MNFDEEVEALTHDHFFLGDHHDEILEAAVDENGGEVEDEPAPAAADLRRGNQQGQEGEAGAGAGGEERGQDEEWHEPVDAAEPVVPDPERQDRHHLDREARVDLAPREQEEEPDQIQRKKPRRQRHESDARQARDQRAEGRIRERHRDQRAGPQPGQVGHAAGHAGLVGNRPDHVVRGQDRVEIDPAPPERRQLLAPDLDYST